MAELGLAHQDSDAAKNEVETVSAEHSRRRYLHWWDWNQWGFVAALRALAQLRERGVVKEVGVTNIDAPRLRPLLETPPPGCPKIACVQVRWPSGPGFDPP